MAIDFTLTPELEDIRDRVRTFIAEVVKPAEDEIDGHGDHEADKDNIEERTYSGHEAGRNFRTMNDH